jgi:fibronectin-binding autotransporter adhesin
VVAVTNDGTITDRLTISQNLPNSLAIDGTSFTVTNNGQVEGGPNRQPISIGALARTVSVVNSGTVSAVAVPPTDSTFNAAALWVGDQTVGDNVVSIVNSGNITNAALAGTGILVFARADNSVVVNSESPLPAGNSVVTVTNSGTVLANAGAAVDDYGWFTANPNMSPLSAIGAFAAADGTSSVTITNTGTGIIEANGALRYGNVATPVFGPVAGHPLVAGAASGLGSIAVAAYADRVTIDNSGKISGGVGGDFTPFGDLTLYVGDPVDISVLFPSNYVAGAIQTFASIDTVRNTTGGIIIGSVDLGAFDDSLENLGAITGNIFLRDGDDSLVQALGGSYIGTADGGAGTNSLTFDISGSGALSQAFLDQFVNFTTPVFSGTGTVRIAGPFTADTLNLLNANLTVAAGSSVQTAGQLALTYGVGSSVSNLGTIDSALNNVTSFTNGATGILTGLLTNSAGTTTNAGALNGGATVSGGMLDTSGILAGGLANAATVNATGGAINGGITNHAGGTFNVAGTVTSDGSFSNSTTTSVLNLNSGSLTLGGALTNAGAINFNGGTLGAALLSNLASGTINGVLNLASGNDSIINQGRITGAVTLGAGDDQITVQQGGTFGAGVDGGVGNDTLILAAGGSDANPQTPDMSGFTAFERLRQTSGVVSLGGAFTIGVIDIAGGRLIGQAGSTISASTITVNTGATFGSAGTVNANINVNGTLSPGASPGLMNIVGNVALASGSTTLLEMTPTISDQLVISGTLDIASNATLTLTGARPLTPGSTFDLIVANGGITGNFATINKPGSILGFIVRQGNRIQLLGQFAIDASFNPQIAATVNYVNILLTSGQPNAVLVSALPNLLTTAGDTNATAFAQLNPEAYATVSQIGTENGLSLAKALRSGAAATARDDAGLFTFAQGLGDWRKLKGNTALGISKTSINSYGMLGGLGYGSTEASFGAFVGYLNARQNISALGARNTADGIIYGASGRIASGAFQASATLAMDGSKGKTSRVLLGGAIAAASYSLKSFVGDVSLGYAFSVGDNWEVSPRLGYTHVSTKRAAASETGGGAFGLTIGGERYKADFVDASINLKGGTSDAALKPMLGVGLRHLLNGNRRYRGATAGFTGASQTFTALGGGRAKTLATGSVGFSYRLGSSASLFASYEGEFGDSGTGHNANVGINIGL